MTGLTEKRLAPLPDWLQDSDLCHLVEVLTKVGITGRFVGGCVRDALINRPVTDIDLAVDRPPDAVSAALEAAGIRTHPTGLEHGTLTAVLDSRTLEITSLRRDVETDGRRAVVAFTEDWEEDALRRDFTINALYVDLDGRIYDHHDGLADLEARRLRFIGEADTRIREDVLRILRFFRFHAQLGISPFDPEGLAACQARRDLLPGLSAERVSTELRKILASPDPSQVLEMMITGGFLIHWLPEIRDLEVLERLGSSDPLLRLAAIVAPDAAGAIGERLRFSRKEQARLAAALRPGLAPASDAEARAMIYRDGADTAMDRARLGLAQGTLDWARLLGLASAWEAPTFPLSGADAKAAGFAPGPEMGTALRTVETAWIDSDFALPTDTLRAMLTRLREETTQ